MVPSISCKTILCLTLITIGAAEKHMLPPPTGKLNVGAIKHAIPFYNTYDVSSPGGIQSEYLATIYYPTLDQACRPAQVIDQGLADILEPYWELTPGTMTSTMASISWNATFLPEGCEGSDLPTLIFGPGGLGPPTDVYITLLSDLASHGYVVAALDHPYEQPFLRFENGTGLVGLPTDFNPPDLNALYERVYDARINDTLHFISVFPDLVQSIGARWNTSVYGDFGHSLGGAAAIGAAYESEKLVSVLNMDGSNWGRGNSSISADLSKPASLLGSEFHGLQSDLSWDRFAAQQTGSPFLWATVNGTEHVDWSDATFWKTFDEAFTSLGPIDGVRMVEIMRRYVRAWFDLTLLGWEEPLLEESSDLFPEVNYIVVQDHKNS